MKRRVWLAASKTPFGESATFTGGTLSWDSLLSGAQDLLYLGLQTANAIEGDNQTPGQGAGAPGTAAAKTDYTPLLIGGGILLALVLLSRK